MIRYDNAYTEVYVILNSLVKEDYNKIPSDVINAIRENRNKNYRFEIDDKLDLKEQKLLPETKAILFNLFRDYLATKEQKEKIVNLQSIEKRKIEEKKKEKYKEQPYFFEKKHNKNTIQEKSNLPERIRKESLLKKITNFIKKLI